MRRRLSVSFAIVMAFQGAPLGAEAFVLQMPPQTELSLELREAMATRSLAIGPFQDGTLAAQTITAPLEARAFRIPADKDMSTATLLTPLRRQLTAAGFTPLYECESRVCGGFDFRYGMDLLPEPEMHVDLGDFHYFLAQKGADMVSLMVSRSPNYGFVQVTQMGDWAKPAPRVTESSKSPVSPSAIALSEGAVLKGVVFASGQAQLEQRDIPALQELADWLVANPTQRVTITGHTDSSGQAGANMALSLARASTLRDLLVTQYQISADRISAMGAGDTLPLAPNDTAEGRAKNRRVEVVVTP